MSTTAYPAASRRAVIAAFAGSFIEWYDFYLFGTASALIIPLLFFPESTPTLALIQSFGTFAVGFLTRPIGAILFGHFGDRIGRKPMLLITVLLMGLGTLGIGLLPTYQTLGTAAAAILIALRLVQGIGIGGEFGGGALLALESAPANRRGFASSFHQMGTPAGLLVSTGIFALVNLMPRSELLAWGWRIPFLISGLFLILAFYIRRHLPETQTFAREKDSVRSFPLFSLIREQPRALLIGLGARMADAVTFNIINVFAVSFATLHLGLDSGLILAGFVVSSGVQMIILPFIGAISDRIGRRPVYLFGIGLCAVGALFYFPVLSLGNVWLTWIAIIVVHAVGTGCMFAIQGAFFAELFGTRMRYTGLGLVYQGSALIGGGPTPVIAVALTALAGYSYWPAAGYLILACALSAFCVWKATETFHADIGGTGPRSALATSAPVVPATSETAP